MDRSSYKHYHKDQPDTRPLLETYFSPDPVFKDDAMKGPIEKLHSAFKKGHMAGKILIDISASPTILNLYTASEFFQELIVMRTNDKCVEEIIKWKNDCPGAFNWEHAASHVVEVEGKGEESEAKEMKMKSTITQVVKFDTETESLGDLIKVSQADCVITSWLLDIVPHNQDDYIRNLRKMIALLKPGGHMIIFGVTNISYYTIGEHRFHAFTYDENFARKALVAEGMTVLQSEVTPRKSESNLIDYDGVLFMIACKQK
ncbi:indolethylamine N-methyltransferase-like [Hyperolius riggenbachi]|uniref:indolethylamine N-methyltransferase-like n=1 Tax=Hyperolius riggenbachi TaxID=752182 RepID=UPI0035A3CBD6